MADQFADAPEDTSLPSLASDDAFRAPHGANTAGPLPGRAEGAGYIDDVEDGQRERERERGSEADGGSVAHALVPPFQRLEVQSPLGPLEQDAQDEEAHEDLSDPEQGFSDFEEEEFDEDEADIENEDWEVADQGRS